MQSIDAVQTSDNYAASATLSDVFKSNGGYFTVSDADVFVSLQYGPQGETYWTDEVHVPQGNGVLPQGVCGVKFRSYVAGAPATVTAALASQREPSFIVTAGGQAGSTISNLSPLPLYRPSGDTSGAEDRGQINTLIANNGGVQLAEALPGGTPYYIDSPILLQQDGMALRGVALGYPFSNNPPYRSGTVIVAATGFSGSYMVTCQQAGVPTAALAGLDLRDLTLYGNRASVAGLSAVYFQAFRSRVDNVGCVYFDADGIVTEGVNSLGTFPGDASENTLTRCLINTLTGWGMKFLSATDNLVSLPEIANCDSGGVSIDANSAGVAVRNFYIYATTMMPYGVQTATLYDVKVNGGRFSGIRQPVDASGSFYGSDFSHFTAQASNQAGDDGVYSAVTITPNATASYGGNVGPITVESWPGTNVRFLHGVVIANANAHGWTILPITDCHAPAIGSAMTGARVLDAGTATRNFDALA